MLRVAVGLCLGAVLPGGLRAQDPDILTRLRQAQLEYQSAQQDYQAARDGMAVAENRFSAVLDSLSTARASGDDEAEERALGRVVALSGEVERQQEVVAAVADSLDASRRAFLRVLDERLAELDDLLTENPPPTERARLETELTSVRRQFFDIEGAQPDPVPAGTFLLPNIRINPRDTPQEIQLKISLLERRVTTTEEHLTEVRNRIQRAQVLLRTQRMSSDFTSGLGRFEDTRLPTGATGQARDPDDPVVADTTNLTLDDLSFEQQIEALRVTEEKLVEQIGLLDERIAVMRAAINREEPDPDALDR